MLQKNFIFTLLYLSVFNIQAQEKNLEIIEVTTKADPYGNPKRKRK